MAEIYGLYSARDGIVRYVGETGGERAARFKRHMRIEFGRYITPVYTWLHAEWGEGYPVRCALLQWCPYAERLDVEREWISKFPNLLNERKYRFRGGRPPVIPEIKDYMRSHIFNCGGFRGIHYWKGIDRYAVFNCTGSWLIGDEAPGWGGNIFFSDRTEALKARNKYRQGRQRNWLPDIEQEREW